MKFIILITIILAGVGCTNESPNICSNRLIVDSPEYMDALVSEFEVRDIPHKVMNNHFLCYFEHHQDQVDDVLNALPVYEFEPDKFTQIEIPAIRISERLIEELNNRGVEFKAEKRDGFYEFSVRNRDMKLYLDAQTKILRESGIEVPAAAGRQRPRHDQ